MALVAYLVSYGGAGFFGKLREWGARFVARCVHLPPHLLAPPAIHLSVQPLVRPSARSSAVPPGCARARAHARARALVSRASRAPRARRVRRVPVCVCVCVCACAPARARARVCTRACSCACARAHARLRVRARARAVRLCTCVCACVRARVSSRTGDDCHGPNPPQFIPQNVPRCMLFM